MWIATSATPLGWGLIGETRSTFGRCSGPTPESGSEGGWSKHQKEALDAWLGQLMSRLQGRRIGVAIEQKHGAVVWVLLKYECVEIYPIHPQAAGQFRQALYPSGGKSDPVDGELLLELLVHHRDRLRPLEQDDEPTRRLLLLVEQRRHWGEEEKGHGNRF